MVFWRCRIGSDQPVNPPSMHEVCAHQAGESERAYDGFLCGMGEMEHQIKASARECCPEYNPVS